MDVHPVERLFSIVKKMRYPEDVEPAPGRIDGVEFFPGGYGLWNAEPSDPDQTLPTNGVIVLGHYLDSKEKAEQNLRNKGPKLKSESTWVRLKELLDGASLSPERCFLTNFYMGVAEHQTGTFPGSKDREFVADCLELLREEIRLLRPQLLLVLGAQTWRHLADLTPDLDFLKRVRSYPKLDAQDLGLIREVHIPGAPAFNTVFVVHPSYAHINRKHRAWRGLNGLDAEVALVQEGMRGAS